MTGECRLFHAVRSDPQIRRLIDAADEHARELGLNEHGLRHVLYVARTASTILRELGFNKHVQGQAGIAGFLHDVGNAVSREDHASTGARIAGVELARISMSPVDIAVICGAIRAHGDDHGKPGVATDAVSAALMLADKSDVHRSRVRGQDVSRMDRHDRVGYSVVSSSIRADHPSRTIHWELVQDVRFANDHEFLDLFSRQLVMCRRAARFLDCDFEIACSRVASG